MKRVGMARSWSFSNVLLGIATELSKRATGRVAIEMTTLKSEITHIALSGLAIVHHKPKALPWAVTFCPFGASNEN